MRKELTIEETQEIFDNEGEVCFYMGQKAFLTGQGLMVRHLDGGTEPMQGLLIDFIKGPRWLEVPDKPACELPESVEQIFNQHFAVSLIDGSKFVSVYDYGQVREALTALHRHWQEQSRQQDAYHEARLATAHEEIKALQAKVERMENHYHPMSMDSKLKMAGPSYPTSTAKEGE